MNRCIIRLPMAETCFDMLHINSSDAAPTTSLDVGSDYRAVRRRVQVPPITKRPRKKPCGLRGWLPDNPSSYHATLRDKLQQKQPDNILDLEDVLVMFHVDPNGRKRKRKRLSHPQWKSMPLLHVVLLTSKSHGRMRIFNFFSDVVVTAKLLLNAFEHASDAN